MSKLGRSNRGEPGSNPYRVVPCNPLASPEILSIVGGPIVYAISFATVGYIGGNVADNALKGRFYRPELDREMECGEKYPS